ncbi:MAG: hypothetical protein IJQ34_04565 [Kiritimatiellae bacterium]|nr:hypothetical protein [Kiritimatiellia bacterium]
MNKVDFRYQAIKSAYNDCFSTRKPAFPRALAALSSLIFLAHTAWAETYYQKKSDAENTTSFTAGNWARAGVEEAVAADDTSGNIYVTALGGTDYSKNILRTSAGSDGTFPGETLQIGTTDTAGHLFMKVGKDKTASFNNLTLVNGTIAVGDKGATETLKVTGTTKVESTSSNPFVLGIGGDGQRNLTLDAELTGENTAVLKVIFASGNGSTSSYLYLPKASPNYNGKWIVDGKNLKTGMTFLSLKVADDPASALGAEPASIVKDFLTLMNKGVLDTSGLSADATLSGTTRGITVPENHTGYIRNKNNTLTLKMPVYGAGTLMPYFASDDATAVVLDGSFNDSVSFDANGNTVMFGANFAWNSTGTFSGLAEIVSTIASPLAVSAENTVVDLDGAKLTVEWGLDGSGNIAAGTATFGRWPLDGEVLKVNLSSNFVLQTTYSRVPVVKINTSVKIVTKDNFTTDTRINELANYEAFLSGMDFEVETDSDGLQTVYLTRIPYVWQTKTMSTSPDYSYKVGSEDSDKCPWSNGEAAQAGQHYILRRHASDSWLARTPLNSGSETFPGASWTFINTKSSSYSATLNQKCKDFTANGLRLGPGGVFAFAGHGTTTSTAYGGQTLYGSLYIFGSDSIPSKISSGSNRTSTLAATLSGSGSLIYSGNGTVTNTADNSSFTGTVKVQGNKSSEISTLALSAANQLGGALSTTNAKGLELYFATLSATDTFAIDATRGVMVSEASTINVEETKTLTINGALAFASGKTLTKTGAGDLIFNGDNSGTLGTFDIKAGKVFLKGLTTAPTLAAGTYAKRTVDGIWLSNTEPAASEITIKIATSDTRTIDLDSSDALYTWLAGNGKTEVADMNSYLTTNGTGGMNGFEAYMLGYDNSEATPKLKTSVSGETVSFSFDGNVSRSLQGVSVTYSVESSNDHKFATSEFTEGNSLTLTADSIKTYNRLIATILATSASD